MTDTKTPPLAKRTTALADVSLSDENAVEHDADAFLLSAVEAALLAGETHYTVRPGIPELRRMVTQEIVRLGGPFPDADDPMDNALITSDEAEAIFAIVLGLGLDSGEVLATAEDTCHHEALFRVMGLRVEGKESSETKLTYRSWDADLGRQKDVLDFAHKNDVPDILNLGSSLVGPPWKTFPPFDSSRTFITGNLDGLPGISTFRVAYLMASKDRIARCRPWKQALSICSAAPSQRAAIHALSGAGEEES
jgi:aspartate/methionine/tyrosine aminotransferase